MTRRNIIWIMGIMLVIIIGGGIYIGIPLYEQSFYNPGEGYTKENGRSEQFFLDVATFTELHFPGYITSQVAVERTGFGEYTTVIRQGNMFSGKEEVFTSQVIRNKMQAVGEHFYRQPAVNVFYDKGPHHYLQKQDEEGYRYQMEELERLPETSIVSAYVGFEEEISMERFAQLVEQHDDLYFSWVGIKVGDKEKHWEHTGFEPTGTGRVLEEGVLPEEQYPYFELANAPREGNTYMPVILEEHFKTLLKYMATREPFLETMCSFNNFSTQNYKEMLDYVEANGIRSYGVLVQGSVGDVLEFMQDDLTETIHVDNVKLSRLAH